MIVFQSFSIKYLLASESTFTSLVRKWKMLYSTPFSVQKKGKWGKEGRKERRKEDRKKEKRKKE